MSNRSLRVASLVVVLGASLVSLGACLPEDSVPAAGTGANDPGGGVAGTPASAGATSAGVPSGGAATGGASSTAGSSGFVSTGGMATGGVGTAGNTGTPQAGMGGASSDGGQAGTGSSGGSAGGPVNTDPVVGQCKDDFWPAANNGSVTRYDFKQGTQLPACTYVITHTGSGSDGDWDTVEGISTGDGGYFGAMNTEDYAAGAACGACVEATYSGRKIVLTIVDECPKSSNPVCNKGHIDLSRKAIRQLEPNGSLENLQGVSWRYVKCPASGNVKARIHPNQNANWQPVVFQNGLFPLKSVTLNGVAAKRVGNTVGGNAWEAPLQKAPYAVRATDINGGAISFNVSGGNDLKDTGHQFMCQ